MMQLCYEGEPGRVGRAGTGSDHPLPLEGKQMAEPKLRNLPLSEKLDRRSMPEPNSGCQLWLGGVNPQGYGRLWHDGGPKLAHRLAFEVANGPIPDGLHLLHKCDVPSCINPAHLRPGTQAANIADMMAKGRFYRKLTADAVREIRTSDEPGPAIAARFEVDASLIPLIRNRKIWRHV